MVRIKYLSCLLVVCFSLAGFCPKAGASTGQKNRHQRSRSLASYTMGVVYDLQGYTEKAIQEYERSAAFDDNYAAHLRLGTDYARLGMLDEAQAELQLVLDKDPGNIQSRYLLALIYSSRKNFEKAALEYEAILKSFSEAQPENKEIYGYLGQLYYSQQEYDKAISQFETYLNLDPANIDALFLLGSLYLEQGQNDRAQEYFLRCTKADPSNRDCLNSLGYLYAEKGVHLDKAETMVRNALENDPQNGAYLDSLGWIYFKKGEYDKALTYLNQANRYLEDPVVYEHLGDVYFQLDQTEEAKKFWSLSLDLKPGQADIREKLELLE